MKRSRVFGTIVFLVSVTSLMLSCPVFAGWDEDGSLVCSALYWQEAPAMIPDGANGAFIVWHDWRYGEEDTQHRDIFMQHADSSGALLWAPDGIGVCTAYHTQMDPRIISDGAGGSIITWRDYRNEIDFDVYAQRVDPDGNALWTADGEPICRATGSQLFPELATDGAGGAIIAWYDLRNGANTDVYAQRIDASGDTLWVEDGVPICTISGDQKEVAIISDGSGGAIMAWTDARYKGIYAQRVDGDGNALWTADGVAICIETGEQRAPRLAPDGEGGAIIVWRDPRGADLDIYAQRINAWGDVLWATDGIPVCSETGHQQDPQILWDGAGAVFMAWQDARFKGIYAQHMDTLGVMSWTAGGAPVCTTAELQRAPVLTLDGAGGAIFAWRDNRNINYDIFAQRLDASGAPLWTMNGVAICTASFDQKEPCIISDGEGGAITAWGDFRDFAYDIYAHRVDPDGVTDLVFAAASADVRNGCVVLSWEMAVDVSTGNFSVQRAESQEGNFVRLNVPIFKTSGTSFTCTDNTVQVRKTYWYRIVLKGVSAEEVYGPIKVYVSPGVVDYRVHQSYPNPFNPVCTIRFEIPNAGPVKLRVFDVSGSLVRTLVDGWREPAEYSEVWDGRGDDGSPMPSGVYFYQLEAGDFVDGMKMVLLR